MTHDAPGPPMVVCSSGDFVAFVPAALGFVPADSLVMLTFDKAGMSFHARVDHDADDPDAVAQVLLRPALRHRITAVVFLLYVPADSPSVEPLAWLLRDTFMDAGIECIDFLRVTSTHWFAVLPGHEPSAYEGIAHDVSSHRFTAQSVVAGRVQFPDRLALAASVECGEVDPDAFAERMWQATVLSPDALARVVARRANGGDIFTDAELSNVVLSVVEGHRRDRVWTTMDRSAARQAVELWRNAVQRVPDPWCADICAVLGFIAWLCGDGALAWCAVARTYRVAPEHTLAALVADLLDQATHPDEWERWRNLLHDQGGPAA